MNKKYITYKEDDFLLDDLFVESTLDPTPQSEAFWQSLIQDGLLDKKEYVAAYVTCRNIHAKRPEAPRQRLDELLRRIEHTTGMDRKPVRPTRRYAWIGAACAGLVAVGVAVLLWQGPDMGRLRPGQIAEAKREYVVEPGAPGDKIELVTGGEVMSIEGREANVEYGRQGSMKVNEKTVGCPDGPVQKVETCQIRVPYGKRAFLKLADGTSLWINSGSTVIYPSAFTGSKREIFVEGEVYADVAHDPSRPFSVATSDMEVTVLGTVFNLSAYREDKQTNLVLVSGLVNAKPKNGEVVRVTPDHLLTYSPDGACSLREVNVENYISWRDGLYIFSGESLENVLMRIARYYNVTMKLPASSQGITCSGKLVLKDDLEEILHGLSTIAPMQYEITENHECRVTFD